MKTNIQTDKISESLSIRYKESGNPTNKRVKDVLELGAVFKSLLSHKDHQLGKIESQIKELLVELKALHKANKLNNDNQETVEMELISDKIKSLKERRDELDQKIPSMQNKNRKKLLINSFLSKNNIDKYLIQSIPESYIKSMELDDSDKSIKQLLEVTKEDQNDRIHEWVNYLTSQENEKIYPNWFQYLVINEVLKMDVKGKKRRNDTVSISPLWMVQL